MIPITAATPVKAANSRPILISIYAAFVTFLAYTCVYAYRKPFTVATFDDVEYAHIPYQTLLIVSQGIGYMLSKFYGIKFIAELKRIGRWKTMAVLISISWLALLGFAVVPAPYGIVFMLINGFPLGFFWGIVFSYVEGRRATDIIGSAMAVSFVFAGGFTRSVAKWLLVEYSVAEKWMPFLTGLIFLFPFALFVFLLEKIPAPDAADVYERTERAPMNGKERKKFLKIFGPGIVAVTITYLFLTLLRDIRDNYMANIWNELGHGSDYSIFTRTETITSITVLALMGLLVVIRKNVQAFRIVHLIIALGLLLSGISSVLFVTGYLAGDVWMQLIGLGLYMAYIPFNCIFFERLIATFRIKGNVGFLIYFADAFGYLASSFVMCSKALLHVQLNWSHLYSRGAIIASAIGLITISISFAYFNRKYRLQKTAA